MGILNRFVARSADSFWRLAEPVMANGEQRLDYAHLRCVSGRENLPGTLFLTDRQVIWRVAIPGLPRGAGFETPLAGLHAVGRVQGVDDPGAFMLAMELRGEVGSVLFFPQRPKDQASVIHANTLEQRIHDEWRASRPTQD
jgi:hypothetical protein